MSVTFDGAAVAAITGGRLLRDGPAGPIGTDTRTLTAGSWFVALRGDRFDGHAFLDRAAAAGCAGCVVDTAPEHFPGGVVVVPNTLRALQDLARQSRRAFAGPVIGLTGSSGKTTTRALIALAVRALGPVHQTTGNLNNHVGVPLTLLARPADAAVMVVEMGTSAPGEIRTLAEIAEPDVRLIVNVGPAHLEELGGLDGVALEKGAIFATARPGDVVCVNVDDPRVAARPLPAGVRRVTWGEGEADVRLLSAEVDAATLSTLARYRTPEGEVEVRIPAPGRHIASNGAGALACAVALGLDPAAAAAALADYQPVGMRMRSEPLPGGAHALNDAYNANPASMEASLRVLAGLPGRRAAVLGDMLELGPEEGEWHRRLAALAGALQLDLVVLVGPRMAAAAAACPGAWAFEDGGDAVAPLRAWLRAGDTVLFKGSRGARVERVLHGLRGETPGGDH